jgi:HEPN domain-containing protein
MSTIDTARTLLLMAGKDLKALGAMTDTALFAEEIFGFHAQQAVEKSLKAWLAALHQEIPLTHDLRLLIDRLATFGCPVENLWELLELAPYAVQFRYDVSYHDDEPLERHFLIDRIQNLYDHVLTVVLSRDPQQS